MSNTCIHVCQYIADVHLNKWQLVTLCVVNKVIKKYVIFLCDF